MYSSKVLWFYNLLEVHSLNFGDISSRHNSKKKNQKNEECTNTK